MDVKTYERLAHDQWDEVHVYTPYWYALDEHIISRCPFTGKIHKQLLDTYSLLGWQIRFDNSTAVSFSPNGYYHSPHLFVVHTFLNLNGNTPSKRELGSNLALYSTEPEVPLVTPSLLSDDDESYVVLHSNPIKKLWGNTFKEAYTLYTLSYYAHNPRDVLEKRKMMWTAGRELVLPGWGYARACTYWEEATPECWDLEHWLKKGKLRWMNDQHGLVSDVENFPYANIDGMRHGYSFERNTKEINVVHTHPTIEEFQSNERNFEIQ